MKSPFIAVCVLASLLGLAPLAAQISNVTTSKPPAAKPAEDPAAELARLKAENAKLNAKLNDETDLAAAKKENARLQEELAKAKKPVAVSINELKASFPEIPSRMKDSGEAKQIYNSYATYARAITDKTIRNMPAFLRKALVADLDDMRIAKNAVAGNSGENHYSATEAWLNGPLTKWLDQLDRTVAALPPPEKK